MRAACPDHEELTRFPTSRRQRITGWGNEEPIRDGDREQQRCDAFEQLPTCTHANPYWKFRHFRMPPALYSDRRGAMLLAKPEAGKRRGAPGASERSRQGLILRPR